jgi:hypothetical protein
MRGSEKSKSFIFFIIILGAICGSLIGDLLGSNIKYLSVLKNGYNIGTKNPLVLDLKILSISFGINFSISLMTIIGIILAIILYRKI